MEAKVLFFSDFTEKPSSLSVGSDIHLWIGKIDRTMQTCPSFEDEKEAKELDFADDQLRFFIRRTVLRTLISQYLDISPLKIQILKEAMGKLYVSNSLLHFNLSHSDDWLAIAFSWKHPIGIDIEVLRPLEGMDQIIEDCFSLGERAYVKEQDTTTRFWKIWNRKEAYLKSMGLGIQKNMTEWDCLGNGGMDGWAFLEKKQVWVRSFQLDGLSIAVAIGNKK